MRKIRILGLLCIAIPVCTPILRMRRPPGRVVRARAAGSRALARVRMRVVATTDPVSESPRGGAPYAGSTYAIYVCTDSTVVFIRWGSSP